MAINATFYLAWVSAGETAWNGAYAREDELVYSFEMKHEEGQFCELELEIANPYIALLSRPTWAWFSVGISGSVYPLFFGRLVAVPGDLFAELLKIKLLAKPSDYAAQKAALADSLKVLPFYDPIFIDNSKLDDPNTALEGYSKLWHVDRFAQTVSVSDIIMGEDGTAYFSQSEVFYDSVSMKLSGAPLLICEIVAEVEWTQCDHTGVFEMKTVPNTDTSTGQDQTAGGGGGGVRFEPTSKLKEPSKQDKEEEQQVTYSWEYKNIDPGEHEDGDLMEEKGSVTIPFYGGELTQQSKTQQNADAETGQGEEYDIRESYKKTWEEPSGNLPQKPQEQQPPSGSGGGATADTNPKSEPIEVKVEVEQDRVESMYVAMQADVQPVLAELTEDEKDLIESLTMNSQDLVAAGVLTSHDGAYFATARGQQSIEYLLNICRAHLLAGSRVVEVEWECPFHKIIGLSCRMNAQIDDPRLPGASVLGKIVSYEMSGDGDNGEFIGKVTIQCSVGTNLSFSSLMSRRTPSVGVLDITTPEPGTPVYVEEGYVDPGYQHYAGKQILAQTGDYTFELPEYQQVGLQLPITEEQIILRHEYHDGGLAVTTAVNQTLQTGAAQLRMFQVPTYGLPLTAPPQEALDYAAASQALDIAIEQQRLANPSWVEMDIAAVQGIQARADYEVIVSLLEVPKQIDLGTP